jgi:hypothetical protein
MRNRRSADGDRIWSNLAQMRLNSEVGPAWEN